MFPKHPRAGAPSRVDIALIDPTVRREIPFGIRPIPVSRDSATPLALQMSGVSASRLGLGGFLRVEEGMKKAGLYMLRPYDPNRIPVLMIHGLQSSPIIWRNLAAELQADPAISARYQFWVMYYPSGMAIAYSRQLIIDKLKAVRENYDPQGRDLASREMVVIGHSMGGVLSRSLITDVGDRFWTAISSKDFSELDASPDKREELRKLVFFKPVPQVKRAVFFSAPHRGAEMADGWLGRLGARLVRLPVTIVKAQISLVTMNVGLLRDPAEHDSTQQHSLALARSPDLQGAQQLALCSRRALPHGRGRPRQGRHAQQHRRLRALFELPSRRRRVRAHRAHRPRIV